MWEGTHPIIMFRSPLSQVYGVSLYLCVLGCLYLCVWFIVGIVCLGCLNLSVCVIYCGTVCFVCDRGRVLYHLNNLFIRVVVLKKWESSVGVRFCQARFSFHRYFALFSENENSWFLPLFLENLLVLTYPLFPSISGKFVCFFLKICELITMILSIYFSPESRFSITCFTAFQIILSSLNMLFKCV